MTHLVTAIAIAIMAFAITLLSVRIKVTEEAVDEIDSEKTESRLNELSDGLDRNEIQVAHWQDSIDEIIGKLESITADIARLDQQATRDHSDLVDIRERYILYRDPVDHNTGVLWAKEYPANDEMDS